MDEFKQRFIDTAYSKFGIKAIESINFEQAFAILDEMQQCNIANVVERSEQFYCSSFEDGEWRCETQCLGCAGLEQANL